MRSGPFERSQQQEQKRGWFNPTLSFDGFAAIVAAVLLIRWLSQLDGRVDANTSDLSKQEAQITKLSEAVTKLTILAEINERREQDKTVKK